MAEGSSQHKWLLCNHWESITNGICEKSITDQPYIVVPSTYLFRKFASQIPSTAFVVEIGCANGFCTAKILQRVQINHFVGIDISPQFIRECQAKFPDGYFEMINVLMEWARTQELIEEKFREFDSQATMSDSLHLYVDIGGNREVESLLALLQIIQDRLLPASLVVKSKELFAFGGKHGLDTETAWNQLQSLAQSALIQRRHKPKKYHPLRMPQRYNSEGTAICRFHNYDAKRGCLLFSDLNNHGKHCHLDHEHCHSCLGKGHVAWECPAHQEPLLDTLL
jgi:hypothetical protein